MKYKEPIKIPVTASDISPDWPSPKRKIWVPEGRFLLRGITQGEFEKEVLRSCTMRRSNEYWGKHGYWAMSPDKAQTWVTNFHHLVLGYAYQGLLNTTSLDADTQSVFTIYPLILELDVKDYFAGGRVYRYDPKSSSKEGFFLEGGVPYHQINVIYSSKRKPFIERVPKHVYSKKDISAMNKRLDEFDDFVTRCNVESEELLDVFKRNPDRVKGDVQHFTKKSLGVNLTPQNFEIFIETLYRKLR